MGRGEPPAKSSQRLPDMTICCSELWRMKCLIQNGAGKFSELSPLLIAPLTWQSENISVCKKSRTKPGPNKASSKTGDNTQNCLCQSLNDMYANAMSTPQNQLRPEGRNARGGTRLGAPEVLGRESFESVT